MESFEDPELRQQLQQADRDVGLDAGQWTASLSAVRRKRRRQKQIVFSGVSVAIVLATASVWLALVNPREPNGPMTAAASEKTDLKSSETQPTEDVADSTADQLNEMLRLIERRKQIEQLAALRSKIAGLRQRNASRQSALIKENLSRDWFEKHDFQTVQNAYTKY